MTESTPDTLKWSRRILRVLIKLNLFVGVLILLLFVTSIVDKGLVIEALNVRPSGNRFTLFMGMQSLMILGLLSVPLSHVVLTRLLAIVETVGIGDPFVSDNAARLETMAWAVLVMELLHFVVGGIVAVLKAQDEHLDINWSFSFTRLLVVLLLFVLARVFQQGARMREDLQGTV